METIRAFRFIRINNVCIYNINNNDNNMKSFVLYFVLESHFTLSIANFTLDSHKFLSNRISLVYIEMHYTRGQ